MFQYFKKYRKDLTNLCSPAFIYLLISVISFAILALQNIGNTNNLCIGNHICMIPNVFIIFVFHALYIVFWTFLLNILCKSGYKEISWLLVLFPLILFLIITLLIIINFSIN